MLGLRFLIKYVICVVAIFMSTSLIGQEEAEDKNRSIGIETGVALSYSGLHSNIAFLLKNKKNEYYVGLKLNLSDSYLLQKGPFGIQLGYRRTVIAVSKFSSSVSLDYQLVQTALYNALMIDVQKKNWLNELHLSYGLAYRLSKKLWIGSSFGFGLYIESNYDLRNAVRNRYIGTSNMLRIYANYDIR